MIPAHHREFVAANRLCVLSWKRSARGGGAGGGGPASGEAPPQTPVFYVTEGDDILVSITEDRAKTRALRRDPAISVCVLGEEMPYPYVTVFGTASIETGLDRATEVMSRVIATMGRPLDDEGLRKLRERAEREQRVVLRVTPQRTVSNVPAPK